MVEIKKVLREQGITQKALARQIGVHPVRLCRVVNGVVRARSREVREICAALNLPCSEVFPSFRRAPNRLRTRRQGTKR